MNRIYSVAAALLIATATPLYGQSVKAGIDAWQRSDYAAAIAIWRPLAEHGDADAEFNLGQAYRLGRGVPTNLAAAKTWFERAAEQGHLDAETTLGLLLFENNDQVEGLKWLKKAADQGEPRALLVYGAALVNGDSITKDPALGYAYVSRAADKGLEPARDTLAQLDKMLPLPERKRGIAIARRLGRGAPASTVVAVKQRAKTVETESVKAPLQEVPRSSKSIAAKESPMHSARTAEPAPPASGAWRIQLGAFSQSRSAQELFQKLADKPALAGRHPYYIDAGRVTRLQVGPFETKAAAEAACRSLGTACFPVPIR